MSPPTPITDRPIRIAVLGCGRIAQRHFESIASHETAIELVAVCDSNTTVAQEHATLFGVEPFDDLETMLNSIQLDIVAICTPSGLHPAEAEMIARHGVNVMTEKPMATRWQDGLDMVRTCDECGVHLLVVKQNRLNATLQLLKRAVDEKRFGRIHMVHLNVFWTRPQAYYDSARWRGTWELDGGAFMNQASHYVDLLEWLIGPIADVQAMTGTLARDIEVEDSGVLNVRWRSGALGSMCVTMCAWPKNIEGSITILGERGTVRVGGVAVNKIEHWEFEDARDEDDAIRSASYETESVYGFGHTGYYANMIEVLRGEAAPLTDGRDGLKSLELLIAAYLSARDGDTVSLPLEY
jgi:UDP-N-acetyl-2-amino-2-deoxyglucuronate dehydrogenase